MEKHGRITRVLEQSIDCLRDGLRDGRWKGHLPGLRPLAKEVGVSRQTLRLALKSLVEEGVIIAGSHCKQYSIPARARSRKWKTLRVAILVLQPVHTLPPEEQSMLLRMIAEIQSVGHRCSFVTFPTNKSIHKSGLLSKLVEAATAHVWVIHSGSLEILTWFHEQQIPLLAVGGRAMTLPIASVGRSIAPALKAAVHHLISMGHRRIVCIAPDNWRVPSHGLILQSFKDELKNAGIIPTEYHIPNWEESPEGLENLLNSLFQVTPPTAVITENVVITTAFFAYCFRKGINIPQDVSICTHTVSPLVEWLSPGLNVAQIKSDAKNAFVTYITKWISSFAKGKLIQDRILLPTIFDPGNSIVSVK